MGSDGKIATLLRGAAWGFFAWVAYGIWEYCALTIGPLLRYSDVTLAGWHWKLSLLLLVVYALSGIGAGTAAAVLVVWILPQKAPASGRFQSLRLKCAATLTLVLAFIVNAATAGTGRSILVFAVLAAGALLLCLFSERWADCLASIVSPWSVGVLLLAVGWTTENEFSQFSIATKLLAGTAVTAVYVAGAYSANRLLRALAPAVGTVRSAGATLLLACVIWLVLENRSQAFDASASTLDPSKPNIILLSLDTVRADHLSLYGYSRNTTPNLVRLAQSATLFKHATAAGNITLVSHAAIFTGAYSSWTGVSHFQDVRVPIPAGYPTLAEILAAHGYSTGAVAANYPFLSPAFSMNRGFQFFDNSRPVRMLSPGNEYCLRNGVQRVLSWYWYTGQFDMPVLEASDVNERAFRFIARALPARRPIFLFLNYMEAHERIPPARFRDMFPGRLPRLSHQAEEFFKLGEELANEGTHRGHEAEIAHFVSQYDGAIAGLDDQIGKLMDRLKAVGLFEHSLIIVMSDHGEGLGTGNYVGHGITVHEDQVYVPAGLCR